MNHRQRPSIGRSTLSTESSSNFQLYAIFLFGVILATWLKVQFPGAPVYGVTIAMYMASIFILRLSSIFALRLALAVLALILLLSIFSADNAMIDILATFAFTLLAMGIVQAVFELSGERKTKKHKK